jgi:hypothetical protein
LETISDVARLSPSLLYAIRGDWAQRSFPAGLEIFAN